MRTLFWFLIAAVGVTVAVGCGGGSGGNEPDTAETALTRQFDQVNKGQWGPEWDELHPAQQAIISRDHYIECGSKSDLPNIDDIEIVETYSESITIPGTSLEADSTAITVKLSLSRGSAKNTTQDTYHEVNVDGVWRWSLSATDDYANGQCPPG